jgi:dipeptidase E
VKLLLTAAGLRNETLRQALRDLLGKPFASANFVFISTATNAMPGDHGWLIRELTELHRLGWREFDVLDVNGLPRQMVIDRLLHADVIYGGGGEHFHLARSITVNGLAEGFRAALDGRVYVGISAGSMIFSRVPDEHYAGVFDNADDLRAFGAPMPPPFGLFDWFLKPHLHSSAFPDRNDAWAERMAARADFPIYFIDDETAIRVDGDVVDVVSEGRWRFLP